ncbi:hypothetical protein B0H16DRAFT_1520155, partial [Mycena metata]
MSFISTKDHVTLGDGVYNNVQGNLNIITHNYFHEEKGTGESKAGVHSSSSPKPKRECEQGEDIKIIKKDHITLLREISGGPGYLLHAARTKKRAVILKVFNPSPAARECLESTVALTKNLMHPNVLRIKGVSSCKSPIHFIAYEGVYWTNATVPLARALGEDLSRSITLGFKLIAGISSGMNYLSLQGISLASLSVENFDVFSDVDDRFLIGINPTISRENKVTNSEPWDLFIALCRKALISANRIVYSDEMERDTSILDLPPSSNPNTNTTELVRISHASGPPALDQGKQTSFASPRREYVWRSTLPGPHSLAGIARPIELELEMKQLNLNRVAWRDQRRPHRCAGYIREEITLAPAAADSAVVFHDVPDHLEMCWICNKVVNVYEEFCCKCGASDPGSRPTIQCSSCHCWMHRDCIKNPDRQIVICDSCMEMRHHALALKQQAGGLVLYWDGNGRAKYGKLQRLRRLPNAVIVGDLKHVDDNSLITLPMSNFNRV